MAEVLLITALVLALFFIFFIRPARAAEGRRRRDLNALRIGDEVLTTGGIIATVVAVETPPRGPMILHLEIDEDVVVRAHTAAIEERLRSADDVEASALELSELEAAGDESAGSLDELAASEAAGADAKEAEEADSDTVDPDTVDPDGAHTAAVVADAAGDDNDDNDSNDTNHGPQAAITGSAGSDQAPRRAPQRAARG